MSRSAPCEADAGRSNLGFFPQSKASLESELFPEEVLEYCDITAGASVQPMLSLYLLRRCCDLGTERWRNDVDLGITSMSAFI